MTWRVLTAATLAVLALAGLTTVSALDCAVDQRTDCGYVGIDAGECADRGCCWAPARTANDPWCFRPVTTAPVWNVTSLTPTADCFTASLTLANGPNAGSFGPAIQTLNLVCTVETASRVHFKLTDASASRYEIPESVLPLPKLKAFRLADALLSVSVAQVGETFTLQVVRKADGVTIFDLADLEYSDHYLQLTSLLPGTSASSPALLYGLGEHVMRYQLPTNNHKFTMWNVDIPTPWDQNAYGSHPFYLQTLPGSGAAHGLFMKSSNGMDVLVNPTEVTFKIIGGILDWYVFAGPTHEAVIQQYHAVIGLPHFPPYWSLGWHQSKYGWKSLQEVETVVSTYASHGIPLDTVWADIDFMDQYQDWTWDPVNFPVDQVRAFTEQLHKNGQHYVPIVDPGVRNITGYAPYDEGLEANIFITTGDGKTPYIGQVWPGMTAFPDFLAEGAQAYWDKQISTFLSNVSYDGLWIDMNEISNFINGEAYNPDASVNNPPYAINNFGNNAPLNTKALPMDALHGNGKYQEYDVHNIYGLTEAIATRSSLERIQNVRSFILTRSSFPGSGAHVAHWLGDNHATWDDLFRSVAGVLNANMYGIPMVGSDICGFINPTTEELCGRWTAAGVFIYTFTRNHHQPQENQEPYLWPSVEAVAKKVLAMRYQLLPLLYTQLWKVHTQGGTVLRSLMFNFPTDANTYNIDEQLMWQDVLLVTPVLDEGQTSVKGYFPTSKIWYSAWTLEVLPPSSDGWQTLDCTIQDGILLHFAGGSIVPMQAPELTTTASRLNPFSLLVAFDGAGQATGSLFWDSGADLTDNSIELEFYSDLKAGTLKSQVVRDSFSGALPNLQTISFAGFDFAPSGLQVNGASLPAANFTWNASTQVLQLSVAIDLTRPLVVTWTASAHRAHEELIALI